MAVLRGAYERGRGSVIRQALLLGGALLVSAATLLLALQAPTRFELDLGGTLRRDPDGQVEAPSRAPYDTAYLDGSFHEPEREQGGPNPSTFRWSRASSSITLAGLSGGPSLATLRLSSSRPEGQQPTLRMASPELLWSTIQPPEWRTAHFLVPPDPGGTVRLVLTADPYLAPDTRELGVALDRLSVRQLGWRPWLPAGLLAPLLATLAALALGGLLARVPLYPLGAGILALGLAAALVLLRWRLELAAFAPRLLQITLAALLGLMLGRGALALPGGLDRRRQLELAPVAGLIALAFVIRLVGLQHPQYRHSDLLLNVHNLEDLAGLAHVTFTEQLTCEAGLRGAPYPPGFYILIAPLLLLFSDHALLVQVAAAALDALTVGLIWALVRRGQGGQRSALLAGALYLAPPPLLHSLGVGELSNTGAQFLALAVITLLAWRRWPLAAMTLILAAGLLGHLGVAASLGLLVGCWGLALLIDGQRRGGLMLLVGAGAAAALVAALYYSSFIGDPALQPTIIPGLECPPRIPLGRKLANLWTTLTYQWAILPLPVLMLGLAGVALARRRLPTAAHLLYAWWAAALISLATLLFSAQTVRWQHFLYPALAISGGLLLGWLWERPRAGRLVAGALLAGTLAYGIVFWIHHVATYNH